MNPRYIIVLAFLIASLSPMCVAAQDTAGTGVAEDDESGGRGIAVAPKIVPSAAPVASALHITGTPKLTVQMGHSDSAKVGALSPDGRYALTGASGDDSAAILWDVASGKELKRFVTGFPDFGDLAFTPDGKAVLVASTKAVFLFDVQTGAEIRRFELDNDSTGLYDIDVSPDGKQLLVAFGWADAPSFDRQFAGVLFDIDSGQEQRRFNVNVKSQIWSVAFSPDGRRVLTGGEKGRATLWEVETGQQLRTFVTKEKFVAPVFSLAFSPDGKRVLTGMASWIPNKGPGKCEES
ncbi:MAG: hypothetical protein V3R81_02965, partial [Gammaproteobacteria bacterium]